MPSSGSGSDKSHKNCQNEMKEQVNLALKYKKEPLVVSKMVDSL